MKTTAGIAAAGSLYLLMRALWLEQYFFEIRHFHIGNRGSNKVIKIIHLSDLHFRDVFFSFQRRLARTVNALRPDLLILTGDAIDESATTGRPLAKFLKTLNPRFPKLAVPGNHDHKSSLSFRNLIKIYDRFGVELLVNETARVETKQGILTVTGVDDFIEGEACFSRAVKDVGYEENHILLIHSPKHQEYILKEMEEINARRSESEQLNIQYIFAGHNHGGQVRLPAYVPVLPEHSGNYINGWYNSRPPFLYVSKGFGTSAVPFRFLARAEMAVFHYHLK